MTAFRIVLRSIEHVYSFETLASEWVCLHGSLNESLCSVGGRGVPVLSPSQARTSNLHFQESADEAPIIRSSSYVPGMNRYHDQASSVAGPIMAPGFQPSPLPSRRTKRSRTRYLDQDVVAESRADVVRAAVAIVAVAAHSHAMHVAAISPFAIRGATTQAVVIRLAKWTLAATRAIPVAFLGGLIDLEYLAKYSTSHLEIRI